jgi:hypothetical protein
MILVDDGRLDVSALLLANKRLPQRQPRFRFHVTKFSVTCYFLHTIIAIALRKTDYLSG